MLKNSQNLTNKIMQEIKEKDIKMRPRIYFVAGALSLILGTALSLVAAAFLVHLTSFRLRTDLPFDFLRLGHFGWQPFFVIFPWPLILSTVSLLILGIILLKKYEFSYKQNFAVLATAAILAVLLLGVIIDRLEAHRGFERFEPVKGFYHERLPGKNWVAGEILEVGEDSVLIQSLNGQEIKIFWDRETLLPLGRNFKIGQIIRVFGERENSQLRAKGVLPGRMAPPRFFIK